MGSTNINLSEPEQAVAVAIDTNFLILTGILVLMMQVGFTGLETGASRIKHVKSLLFKNLMDHSAGCLSWFGFGYGIFQGSSAFAGGDGATFLDHDPSNYAYVFNQFGFAATATTIVSGAVTGRMRLEPYVFLSFALTGFIYPLGAHWGWNPSGWLAKLGFLDTAGSCVVHAFGGACALGGAWIVGPRVGLFVKLKRRLSNSKTADTVGDSGSQIPERVHEATYRKKSPWKFGLKTYDVRKVPVGHNPALMTVGTLLLYCSWFGFNVAQRNLVASPESSSRAAVNTLLCSGAGAFSMFVLTKAMRWTFSVEFACNATLCALAAITAPCAYLAPWASVVLGLLCAPLYVASTFVVRRLLGIDDTVDAASVHLTGGAFGTLWLGLTHPSLGLFYGHGLRLFGVQLLAVIVYTALGFLGTVIVLLPFRLTKHLSYSESEQLVGIDYVHFGGEFGKDIDLEADIRDDKSVGSTGDDSSFMPDSSQHSHLTQEGRQNLNDELRRVLDNDPKMRHRFRAFLEVAHRDEGVEFWDAVSKFKSMTSKKKLTAKANEARKIIKTYCLESGSRQVNLSSKIVQKLTVILNEKPDRLVDDDIFNEALDELFKDLKLSFVEFVQNTPNYWLQ